MKSTMLLAFLCGGIAFAAELSPHVGAVSFRYDDNQNIRKWTDMCEVFEKYGFPLTASWVTEALVDDQGYKELGAKMVAKGHEIMDHTPMHNPFVVNISHSDQLQDAKVHHKDDKCIYLDYIFKKEYTGEPFTVKVQKNTFDCPEQLEKRDYILLATSDDKLCWAQRLRKTPDKFQLLDFWARNTIDFGEQEVTFQIVATRKGFDVYPENVRFIARCAKRNFEKMGLPVPKCWIQPGGAVLALSAEQLQKSLEAEGYVSAATYSGKGFKFTCTANWQLERYRMQWGDIHPETETVEQMKTAIADGIAKRRVIISGSHMKAAKGAEGWAKFLKLHDELLAWIKEKRIPVVTQAVLSETFYRDGQQISGNLLPDLARDLDENGRPDGWELASGTSIQDGEISFSQDNAVFTIKNLGGATAGKWTISCDAKLPAGGKVLLGITPMAVTTPTGKTFHVNLNSPTEIVLPDGTQQVTIICKASNLKGQPAVIRNLQILRTP